MSAIANVLIITTCLWFAQAGPADEPSEPTPQSTETITIELKPGPVCPTAPPEPRFTARVTAEDLGALLEMPEVPIQFRLESQRRATLDALGKS